MLYLLANYSDFFGPLRLFEYVSFRAGGAAASAFLLVLLLGPWTARTLKRLNTQAASRYADLFPPEWVDKEKERTPCMGGLLIIGAVVLSSLFWTVITNPISLVLVGSTAAFAALGFLDDYQKVFKKNRDGISARLKLFGQFLIAGLAVAFLCKLPGPGEYMYQLMVPFIKAPVLNGSWLVPVVAVLTIVAMSNAVNLTDGKDGLASGCTFIAVLTFATFAYLMGHRVFAGYLNIPYINGISDAVVFSAAIGGACIGFLWHNCNPAAMFMGDTGSLALGGAIGLLAVLTRQEFLLLLIGFVFLMEMLSVMIQVASFKTTGKRVFLCTPIHHHFERKGWTETQIVVRFWIIAIVFALIALSTLKLR